MDDKEAVPPLVEPACDCECCCGGVMSRSFSGTYLRAVKRKYDEFEERFVIPGLSISQVARVEMANECVALREMVANQQLTIQDLGVELEEERNASSSAANEAMSMILRLQREKAEILMEARQFKRFAEEKMAHDGHEVLVLEDLLYKREQTIQSLTCEVQAYKHRMMSYGLTEDEADGGGAMSRNNSSVGNVDQHYTEIPTYDYPPLKCNLNDSQPPYEVYNDAVDVDKYAFGETPRSLDHLKDLENRINQLEQSPRHSQPDVDFFGTKNVLEKVIVGHSPRRYRHFRRFSTDSSFSNFATVKETDSVVVAADSPKIGSAKEMDCIHSDEFSNLKKVDNSSEVGDDMSDRVYTIDSVHNGVSYNGGMEPKANIGICEDYMSTPRESLNMVDAGDAEIKNLYKRLQALEADKESMRQALISMRTDKVQLVLLKEIAQQLCSEVSPNKTLPVRKTSGAGCSLMLVAKWVTSFVFWRKKARRSKYMSGMSPDNLGLLMLLDKGPRVGHWRCLSSTQV